MGFYRSQMRMVEAIAMLQGSDATQALEELAFRPVQVAERAEWMLVQGGSQGLPSVRAALSDPNPQVRQRVIRIVAWQGDTCALGALPLMRKANTSDSALAAWAIARIEMLHPAM
jgi:hypothetical protein